MGIESFKNSTKDTMTVEADPKLATVVVRIHDGGVGQAVITLDERDVPRFAAQLFAYLAARSAARADALRLKNWKPSRAKG